MAGPQHRSLGWLPPVAIGGAIGSAVRWAVLEVLPSGRPGAGTTTTLAATNGVDAWLRDGLPWGLPWPVLLVNVVGCALLGVLLGSGRTTDRRRLLLGTGFCGGLTTFSTFAVDAAVLWRDARPGAAGADVTGSVVLGLAAFLAGRAATRAASRQRGAAA